MKLTVIIPVFNDINTISILLKKVLSEKTPKQVIVVDDCSTDGTKKILNKKFKNKIDKLIFHKKNKGKGAAIKTAQKFILGEYVIIQDADLEYDPKEYRNFMDEIKKNKYKLKVIYGSRVLKKRKIYKKQNFSHKIRIWGNYLLTVLSNVINDQNLTDAHTCYKMFDSAIFKFIKLKEKGFAFCPEVTTKISKLKIKIHEIPINYTGRTYEEGKKIKTIHGIEAVFALLKYRFLD